MKLDRAGYHHISSDVPFVHSLDRELWLQCCGCKLVHRITFRLRQDGKLVIRVKRHEQETRKLRYAKR